MRWRPGPQKEVLDQQFPEPFNCEDDEADGVGSRIDDSRIPSRSRLGGSSTPSLPPADTVDDDYENDEEDMPERKSFDDIHEYQEDDDPGTDHAIDPQGPSPTWRPQEQQSTCEFTHTITNYSQKRESGCKKAEYSATTVDEFGNRWRLIIYVNGNGRASNHHLSLFLQVADADDLPFGWKKAVSYVLTLEHPSGGNLGYAKRNPDKTFKLCPKAIDWGWSQFITSDRIQQEGYVSNDALVVRASVTVKSSSVNIDGDDAELYLKSAVEDGNAEAVESCLAQGASVNCQFKDDLYTPLHTACSSSSNSGSLEVLNLLLERGANGNACNKWKETPLLIAANNGHHAAVSALLDHGADPSLCSEAGWSALTFAAHKGYDDIVTLLLKAGAPVNVRVIEDLSTPLHKACAGGKPGHFSAVKQLLENGADVHALNKWKETPLLTAANHGQGDAVEALLKHGADPCKCTDTGWSPLSIAAYKGHDDVVRLLLEEGAPTEEADPTLSALLQAATKGLPETVDLLLRHGADHTVTTKKGDTALSILVEQNLIDAAVEMVTEYKASIPRCSRDRKKVQRARLLINLRVKQQQREGLLQMDDDETDEETDESFFPLTDSGISSAKKPKKGSFASAEATARAAEEALLLELAAEESKAQQEEAVANSKRAKKKKKKDRERLQKIKEEEEKEREEQIMKERERQRMLREEKCRIERLKEEKERALKEATEQEMKATLEAEQRRLYQDKMKTPKLVSHKSDVEDAKNIVTHECDYRSKVGKGKGRKVADEGTAKNGLHNSAPLVSPRTVSKQQENSRGWETKNSMSSHTTAKFIGTANHSPPPSTISVGGTVTSSYHQVRKDPSNLGISKLSSSMRDSQNSVSSQAISGVPKSPLGAEATSKHSTIAASSANHVYELPQVVLFRQEKLGQLFQRCAVARSHPLSDPLSVVSEDIIKAVVYRWIVRAVHDSAPFLDYMIPSWTDFDYLTSFMQRQFIAESRKAAIATSSSTIIDMESIKEAGTSFSRLCQGLAKDLVKFKQQMEEHNGSSWTDTSLGFTGSEVLRNGLGRVICIDWATRAQVYLSLTEFSNAADRHVGFPSRLLASMFSSKKRYDIMGMLVSGTSMDLRLSNLTKETLKREIGVKTEVWANPFGTVIENFFGCFDDVDALFRGNQPFGKEDISIELSNLKNFGIISVFPPLDPLVATRYIRRIVDLLEFGDKELVPLSFIVFLPAGCFRETNRSPSINDAMSLDSRLIENSRSYIKCAEVLQTGQHSYQTGEGEGVLKASTSNSLFLFLQNDCGKSRLNISKISLVDVIHSMSASFLPPRESSFSSSSGSGGFSDTFVVPDGKLGITPVTYPEPALSHSPPLPNSSFLDLTPFSNIPPVKDDVSKLSNIQVRPKRGRLFDLIDDGEDVNNLDVVSGVLNSLDVFKSSSSQDIDIEAISLGLMGIGGGPYGDSNTSGNNVRTTSRFVG
jgi:ankyrin repeat protein